LQPAASISRMARAPMAARALWRIVELLLSPPGGWLLSERAGSESGLISGRSSRRPPRLGPKGRRLVPGTWAGTVPAARWWHRVCIGKWAGQFPSAAGAERTAQQRARSTSMASHDRDPQPEATTLATAQHPERGVGAQPPPLHSAPSGPAMRANGTRGPAA